MNKEGQAIENLRRQDMHVEKQPAACMAVEAWELPRETVANTAFGASRYQNFG